MMPLEKRAEANYPNLCVAISTTNQTAPENAEPPPGQTLVAALFREAKPHPTNADAPPGKPTGQNRFKTFVAIRAAIPLRTDTAAALPRYPRRE